jgi:hypothetical protein
MSRRTTTETAILAALALMTVVALTGCAPQGAAPRPTPSAEPTVAPPVSEDTPTPTPTPTFIADDYSCETILPPATLAVFKSKKADGFTLQKDFVQRVHNFDSNLALFDTYGGILCQWAYPGAQKSVDYGFSSITAEQSTEEQATLTKNGYEASEEDNGTLLANPDSANFPDNYLFIDGYWMYASSRALLDTIVENVFSTPDE